jgi:hypothetical protein
VSIEKWKRGWIAAFCFSGLLLLAGISHHDVTRLGRCRKGGLTATRFPTHGEEPGVGHIAGLQTTMHFLYFIVCQPPTKNILLTMTERNCRSGLVSASSEGDQAYVPQTLRE